MIARWLGSQGWGQRARTKGEDRTSSLPTHVQPVADTITLRKAPLACLCPITAKVMDDPVIVDAPCKHTVSREAAMQWIIAQQRSTCPVCRAQVTSTTVAPNAPLRDLIELLRPQFSSSPPFRHKRIYDDGVWGEYFGELDSAGNRCGNGRMIWEDGRVYECEWKDDVMEGQGTYRHASGFVYEGQWKNGSADGWGTWHRTNGHVFKGQFKKGQKEGRGTFRHPGWFVYEGHYSNDKRHGRGICRTDDGQMYFAEYKHGEVVGEGVRWSADRRAAWLLKDGHEVRRIDPLEASKTMSRMGFPRVPLNVHPR